MTVPENRNRFVVLCQQALATATVLAVAAPAASVVTLDIVPPDGDVRATPRPGAGVALVAAEPVEPEVTELPVDGVERAGLQALTKKERARANGDKSLAVLSAPEDVTGYAAVGVTWDSAERIDDEEITVSVRTLDDGTWSDWTPLEYHDEHGPDPDSAEAAAARPGTDPLIVGDVESVQVKAETVDGEAPQDVEISVVDPGATDVRLEAPAIDTADLPGDGTAALMSAETGEAQLVAAEDATPKPQIFSRQQWGADERMRDKSALGYYEVHAGFVHHTVNANDYTREQVPALIRSIYAYHTKSRGWSDVGYNFIVDRFGRIWEGRYGGVDRPVVGAHTLGYNEYSFAMSALGNFDKAKPSAAMLDAYGRLFAWKLSLHGVDASSTAQRVRSRTFPAINGHRDAGQTACPGRYLYAQLPAIRALAAQYQLPFHARGKATDLAGSSWPDFVVRDSQTQELLVAQTGGQVDFAGAATVGSDWDDMDLVAAGHDLTGDGVPDMVGRDRYTGTTEVRPGSGYGTFGTAVGSTDRFAGADQLTGVLDLDRDGNNDLVARDELTGDLHLYPGDGRGSFHNRRLLATEWDYDLTTGVGDFDGDRRPDLMARDSAGDLWLVRGTNAGLGTPVELPRRWRAYDVLTGLGDVTNDGRPDLVARKRRSKLTYVYPGDGAGGFGHRHGPYTTFRRVDFLAAAGDVGGSTHTDLVGRSGDSLLTFANTGGENLSGVARSGSYLDDTDLMVNVGDWNGDGHGDLMTRSASTGFMMFRAGDGTGGFAAPVKGKRAGRAWRRRELVAAVGDITGDGWPDIMAQPRNRSMRIYPGNGTSGFERGYVAHSRLDSTDQTGVGLWNSDGSPDNVVRTPEGELLVYPGNGPGGLTNAERVARRAKQYDWLQGIGDADGDGYPDVLARQRRNGKLWLLPGNGSGFDKRRFVAEGFSGYDLIG